MTNEITAAQPQPPRDAVILAAGKGRRLNAGSTQIPKTLSEVGGMTILERMIRCLREAGVGTIYLVAGFRSDMIYNFLAARTDLTEGVWLTYNPRWHELDSISSVAIGLAEVRSGRDVIVMNADTIVSPEAMQRLVATAQNRPPFAVLVDFRHGLGEEETKVVVRMPGVGPWRIQKISKCVPPKDADGESTGVVYLQAALVPEALRVAQELTQSPEARRLQAPALWARLLKGNHFLPVSLEGTGPWTEIDTPEDLRRARSRWEMRKLPNGSGGSGGTRDMI